jgi:hypothetical protein
MFKKKSIQLPSAKLMSEALADARVVQCKHDAQIMWMVFLDRAVLIASQLKVLGKLTDEDIDSMFKSALTQAKAAPRLVPKPFDPNAKPEGKLS